MCCGLRSIQAVSASLRLSSYLLDAREVVLWMHVGRGWTVALPHFPLVVAVWNSSQNPFCEECVATFHLGLFNNGTCITAVGEKFRGGLQDSSPGSWWFYIISTKISFGFEVGFGHQYF